MWAYAIMWITISITTSIGLFITKNPNCLFSLLVPVLIEFIKYLEE